MPLALRGPRNGGDGRVDQLTFMGVCVCVCMTAAEIRQAASEGLAAFHRHRASDGAGAGTRGSAAPQPAAAAAASAAAAAVAHSPAAVSRPAVRAVAAAAVGADADLDVDEVEEEGDGVDWEDDECLSESIGEESSAFSDSDVDEDATSGDGDGDEDVDEDGDEDGDEDLERHSASSEPAPELANGKHDTPAVPAPSPPVQVTTLQPRSKARGPPLAAAAPQPTLPHTAVPTTTPTACAASSSAAAPPSAAAVADSSAGALSLAPSVALARAAKRARPSQSSAAVSARLAAAPKSTLAELIAPDGPLATHLAVYDRTMGAHDRRTSRRLARLHGDLASDADSESGGDVEDVEEAERVRRPKPFAVAAAASGDVIVLDDDEAEAEAVMASPRSSMLSPRSSPGSKRAKLTRSSTEQARSVFSVVLCRCPLAAMASAAAPSVEHAAASGMVASLRLGQGAEAEGSDVPAAGAWFDLEVEWMDATIAPVTFALPASCRAVVAPCVQLQQSGQVHLELRYRDSDRDDAAAANPLARIRPHVNVEFAVRVRPRWFHARGLPAAATASWLGLLTALEHSRPQLPPGEVAPLDYAVEPCARCRAASLVKPRGPQEEEMEEAEEDEMDEEEGRGPCACFWSLAPRLDAAASMQPPPTAAVDGSRPTAASFQSRRAASSSSSSSSATALFTGQVGAHTQVHVPLFYSHLVSTWPTHEADPPGLACKLFRYQQRAVSWCRYREERSLADRTVVDPDWVQFTCLAPWGLVPELWLHRRMGEVLTP